MNIESVKLLKTLKAGENIWIKGTVFPNRNCPYIPKEIMGEAALNRPTVKIISKTAEEEIVKSKPLFLDEKNLGETNITLNVESSVRNKEKDEPITEKKVAKTTRSKPKKKPSLAKRK